VNLNPASSADTSNVCQLDCKALRHVCCVTLRSTYILAVLLLLLVVVVVVVVVVVDYDFQFSI
jgi:hypothetical protein